MSSTIPAPLTATIEVDASPDSVWQVLSDLRRMPELSPELRRVVPLGRRTSGVGARILGINRRGAAVWPTTSRVTRWEPGRAVAWRTRQSGATWVYELEAGPAGGTRVTSRRVLPAYTAGTALLAPLIGGAAGHDRELADGMATTLARLKAVVER